MLSYFYGETDVPIEIIHEKLVKEVVSFVTFQVHISAKCSIFVCLNEMSCVSNCEGVDVISEITFR